MTSGISRNTLTSHDCIFVAVQRPNFMTMFMVCISQLY